MDAPPPDWLVLASLYLVGGVLGTFWGCWRRKRL
jgi:hypothetical protein